MATDIRSTPCIGICSTTYGDLVCRGCKRFAHEIVSWNGYAQTQRDRVWERLMALRDQATAAFVLVADLALLRRFAATLRLPIEAASPMTLAYEVLRRRARDVAHLSEVGLEPVTPSQSPVAVRDGIDA